jgi:hypothetical protein
MPVGTDFVSMSTRALRIVSAILATGVAALHLFYAASGGIAATEAARWSLAFLTLVGAAVCWRAALAGPWVLAWGGMILLAVPAALSWPAIGVSPGGLIALALLLLTLVVLATASLVPIQPDSRPA